MNSLRHWRSPSLQRFALWMAAFALVTQLLAVSHHEHRLAEWAGDCSACMLALDNAPELPGVTGAATAFRFQLLYLLDLTPAPASPFVARRLTPPAHGPPA